MHIISWSYMIFRKKIWNLSRRRQQSTAQSQIESSFKHHHVLRLSLWREDAGVWDWAMHNHSTVLRLIGSKECAANWRRWKSQGHLSSKRGCCAGAPARLTSGWDKHHALTLLGTRVAPAVRCSHVTRRLCRPYGQKACAASFPSRAPENCAPSGPPLSLLRPHGDSGASGWEGLVLQSPRVQGPPTPSHEQEMNYCGQATEVVSFISYSSWCDPNRRPHWIHGGRQPTQQRAARTTRLCASGSSSAPATNTSSSARVPVTMMRKRMPVSIPKPPCLISRNNHSRCERLWPQTVRLPQHRVAPEQQSRSPCFKKGN